MTPKEKARELIKKFDVKYQYNFITGSIPVSMHDSVIKQCALNCVDEILDSKVFLTAIPLQSVNYWQKIKIEIEKL